MAPSCTDLLLGDENLECGRGLPMAHIQVGNSLSNGGKKIQPQQNGMLGPMSGPRKISVEFICLPTDSVIPSLIRYAFNANSGQ